MEGDFLLVFRFGYILFAFLVFRALLVLHLSSGYYWWYSGFQGITAWCSRYFSLTLIFGVFGIQFVVFSAGNGFRGTCIGVGVAGFFRWRWCSGLASVQGNSCWCW